MAHAFRPRFHRSVAGLALGLLFLGKGGLAEALTLSRAENPVVVLHEKALPTERYAAEELAHYLARVLSCKVPIRESYPGAGLPIYIGHQPENSALNPEKLDVEESLVVVRANAIQIVGGRSREMHSQHKEIPRHDRGTLYGVYQFLEELGVRWYRPEPWGEHVPKKDFVELKEGERREKPVYRYRYGINRYQTYARTSDQISDPEELARVTEERKMARRWAVRNRQNCNLWSEPEQGGYYEINFAHAYLYLVPHARYFATHPEYFALVNGVRSSDQNAQLCLSNPEVEDLVFKGVVRNFETRPELEITSLDPNDYSIWCECDGCVAMDDPKLKAAHSGTMPDKIKGVSMSNRVTTFNNRIARRLREVLPDKKVGWYAYMMHTEVPTKVKSLEANTAVMPVAFAGSFSDYSRGLYDPKSSQNARFLKILKGYHKLTQKSGAPMLVHDYWSFYVWPGPLPVMASMHDKLKAYHRDFGVEGVYNEVHPCWGPQGMILYFYTWLLRHPDGDLKKEKEYYYDSFYGSAAAVMKRYHERLERAAWGGPYFGSGGSEIEPLFTDALLRELKPLIEEAERQAAGNEVLEKRIHGVAAGYHYARKVRDFFNLVEAMKPKEAKKTLDELEKYFHHFADGSVFDNRTSERGNFNNVFNRYRKHIAREGAASMMFEAPEILQRHEQGWRFQTDPERRGETAGWNSTSLDDQAWPKVVAGQTWQAQGYADYQGVAWYRKRVTAPTIKKGHRLILYFGAVDGNAKVYVNGKRIGQHLLDPVSLAGYDESFYFDITDGVVSGEPLHLAVTVEKNKYVGGITSPVLLLEAASIRPPE